MDFIALIPAGVVAIAWYLLQQKDANQARDIEQLFRLVHEKERSIAELKLKIAENHYQKPELDTKFDKLERAFSGSIEKMNHDLGVKLDKLSTALNAHIVDDSLVHSHIGKREQ